MFLKYSLKGSCCQCSDKLGAFPFFLFLFALFPSSITRRHPVRTRHSHVIGYGSFCFQPSRN